MREPHAGLLTCFTPIDNYQLCPFIHMNLFSSWRALRLKEGRISQSRQQFPILSSLMEYHMYINLIFVSIYRFQSLRERYDLVVSVCPKSTFIFVLF